MHVNKLKSIQILILSNILLKFSELNWFAQVNKSSINSSTFPVLYWKTTCKTFKPALSLLAQLFNLRPIEVSMNLEPWSLQNNSIP